jgi:hypothetical protein
MQKYRNDEQMFSENCNDIDLVILDLIIPVMGGPMAFTKLRKIDNNSLNWVY